MAMETFTIASTAKVDDSWPSKIPKANAEALGYLNSQLWMWWLKKDGNFNGNPVFRPSLTVMTSGEVYCMIGFPNIVGNPVEKY